MTAITAISELMVSRLCHDLASPAGAIGNGLELLEESGQLEADVAKFMGESAERILASIKFFRLSIGRGGLEGVACNELAEAATDYCQAHGVTHRFLGGPPDIIPHPAARIYLLLVGAVAAIAGRDASLSSGLSRQSGALVVRLLPQAGGTRVTAELARFQAMQGKTLPLDANSRDIFAYLAAFTLAEAGGSFVVTKDGDQSTLTATIPV